MKVFLSSDALFRIRRAWSGVAVQELLYKCAIMRPILVSVLLCCSDVAVARAMTLLPCCCHGFASVLDCCCLSLLPCSFSLCHRCGGFLHCRCVVFRVLLQSRCTLTCV